MQVSLQGFAGFYRFLASVKRKKIKLPKNIASVVDV